MECGGRGEVVTQKKYISQIPYTHHSKFSLTHTTPSSGTVFIHFVVNISATKHSSNCASSTLTQHIMCQHRVQLGLPFSATCPQGVGYLTIEAVGDGVLNVGSDVVEVLPATGHSTVKVYVVNSLSDVTQLLTYIRQLGTWRN